MLSRFVILCLITLSTLCLPAFAVPDAKKDVEQAVKAGYAAEDAAIANKDVDGSVATYAVDAVFINFIGKRTQGIENPRRGMEGMFQLPDATFSANHKIKQFSIDKSGIEATVLVVHHVGMSATSKTGEPFVMGVDEVLRHFWVKAEDGWHIKQERLISTDSTRNGKPFRHNGKPVVVRH